MEGVSGFGSLRKSLRSPIEIWYNPPQIIIPICIREKYHDLFGVYFDPLLAVLFSKVRFHFLKACFSYLWPIICKNKIHFERW